MILTPAQLYTDCDQITGKLAVYSLDLHSLVSVIFATGCREGEVLDRARWEKQPGTTWFLYPQKNNSKRVIEDALLNDHFRYWLTTPGFPYRLSSLMNLRRVVDQFSSYPTAYVGAKQISTHRFRHSYIKQLAIAGKSVSEIKIIMGLSSKAVVNGYINSQIVVK